MNRKSKSSSKDEVNKKGRMREKERKKERKKKATIWLENEDLIKVCKNLTK